MTRYYLGVVTPNGLDPTSYATGALSRLQHGQRPVLDQIQVDTWWTRSHFGDSQIPAADLHARLLHPLRAGTVDPVLRMIGLVDIAGTWHERVAIIDDHAAEIRISNREWITTLRDAVSSETFLTIVFARARTENKGANLHASTTTD